MKILKVLLCFVFILLFSFIAKATNTLNIANSEYSPGETLQINIKTDSEIISTPLPKIYYSGTRIYTSYSTYIRNNEIYFHTPLPTSLENGEYTLKISNLITNQENSFNSLNLEKNFTIYSMNKGFDYINSNDCTNVEECSLAILALNKKYDLTNKLQKLNSFKDEKGCFPRGNCNIKETSLAHLAHKTTGIIQNDVKTWLEGAINSFSVGDFIIEIESKNQGNCIIDGQSKSILIGNNTFDITPKNNLIIDCSQLQDTPNIKLIHGYISNKVYLSEISSKTANFALNNDQCFGKNYKTQCDFESTAFAFWALGKSSNEYIKNNYNKKSTLDNSFNFKISGDETSKNWLISNYNNGYWSTSTLYQDNTPNIYATSFAYLFLNDKTYYEAINKKIKTLQSDDGMIESYKNTALALYSLYSNEKVSSSLYLTPSIIQYTQEQIQYKINLYNKGIKPLKISLESNNPSIGFNKIDLETVSKNSFYININNLKQDSPIIVNYDSKSYTVPIWVENVVETKEEQISIIEPKLIILEDSSEISSIKLSDIGESYIKELKIQNTGGDAKNLTLKLNEELSKSIELSPPNIDELKSGESLDLTIKVNSLEEMKDGTLLIIGNKITNIPITILKENIKEEIEKEIIEAPKEEDEEDLKEEINQTVKIPTNQNSVNNTPTTGLNKENKTNNTPAFLLFFIVLIFVALVGLILYKFSNKKPKEQN